jgi:hypothetical protein
VSFLNRSMWVLLLNQRVGERGALPYCSKKKTGFPGI